MLKQKQQIYADLTPDFIIRQIQKLDEEQYKPSECGSYQSDMARYVACPEQLFLLMHDNSIVGYLCVEPITEKAYQLIQNGVILDDNLLPEMITHFEKEHNHLLALSIVVAPSTKGFGHSQMLIDCFLEFIAGHSVSSMDAFIVSRGGSAIAKKLGMELKEQLEGYDHYSC